MLKIKRAVRHLGVSVPLNHDGLDQQIQATDNLLRTSAVNKSQQHQNNFLGNAEN